VQWRSEDIEKLRGEMRSGNQRTVLAIIGSALIVCAAVIYGLDGYSPAMVGGAPLLTWVLGVAGVGLLAFAMMD